jgi:hypothetical protein
MDDLFTKMGEAVAVELKKLRQRIEALEAGQIKMAGVWKEGESYPENALCSHAGALWLSRGPTQAKPGAGSPAWRLCVKRGDAR